MHHLALMAAETMLAVQGQPCRIIKGGQQPVEARCVSKPSLATPYGGKVAINQFDVSVLSTFELSTNDVVEVLDDNDQVEKTLIITQPVQRQAALIIYASVSQ